MDQTIENQKLMTPRIIFSGVNHDGKNYNCLENFLTQLNMVFKLQPSRFPSDETKVIYAISFEWIQPYFNAVGAAQQDPIATNFNHFTAVMCNQKNIWRCHFII